MYIKNSSFSKEEMLLLEFVLLQDFSKKNEVIEYLNELNNEDIVRDYSPYFRIMEFRTKDILPGYSSGMHELITAHLSDSQGQISTVFTLYEKEGLPFEFEIYNADSSKIDMVTIFDKISKM